MAKTNLIKYCCRRIWGNWEAPSKMTFRVLLLKVRRKKVKYRCLDRCMDQKLMDSRRNQVICTFRKSVSQDKSFKIT